MNRQNVVESRIHIDDRALVLRNKMKNLINENQVLCQQISSKNVQIRKSMRASDTQRVVNA